MLNIGQTLLGQASPPYVNPFLQVDPVQNSGDTSPEMAGISPPYGGMGNAPQTGPGAASPPAAEGNHPWKNYVQGWKDFIGKFKADPNMRLALFQSVLNMTQPAQSWASGIGRGLEAGVGTLQALKQEKEKEADKAFLQNLEERKMKSTERGVGVEESALAQKQNQFNTTADIQRGQLSAEQQKNKDEAQYHRDQIAVEREKIANGGEAGPVMRQWNELTQLVQKLNPSLTPEQAKATAWDIKQSAGKMPRSQLEAQIASQNQIMLPTRNKGESDDAFGKRLKAAIDEQHQKMSLILDAAGYSNPTTFSSMPGMQPGAQPQPQVDVNSLPHPKSAAERDALPPGTNYVAPDGSIKTR